MGNFIIDKCHRVKRENKDWRIRFSFFGAFSIRILNWNATNGFYELIVWSE